VKRAFRSLIVAGALLAILIAASPVAAGEGAEFGACVTHHATTEGGFSADHNPGMHRGFAGWSGCEDA
jgi:hypothetical protein